MGGSRGGKHPKNHGKVKSKKSDTISKKPEARITSNHPDELKYSQSKKIPPNTDSKMLVDSISSKYTENEIQEFLYIKLEHIYAEAKDWLLNQRYSKADVERAILNNGSVIGHRDPLNNVLVNSLSFLNGKGEEKGEAFKDMNKLYKVMLEALINFVMQHYPNMRKLDAMSFLLSKNWGSVPSFTMTPGVEDGNQKTNNILILASCGSIGNSKSEDVGNLDSSAGELNTAPSLFERVTRKPTLISLLRHNVPVVADAVTKHIGTPVSEQKSVLTVSGKFSEEYDIVDSAFLRSRATCSYEEYLKRLLEINPDDPRINQIDGLVIDIRQLQDKVKEQKHWAQKKVIDSANRLSKDFQELNILRVERVNLEQIKNEKLYVENSQSLKFKEKEEFMRKVNCEAKAVIDAKKDLENQNAKIRADTVAFKLAASESSNSVNKLLKKERKCMKKLADIEKQTSIFRAQCDEEKQRVLQLQQAVMQTDKAAEEAEINWKQEIKEKEQLLALLAEETRMFETEKANSRAQLSKLRQKLEQDSLLANDERRRLEDELARLCISQPSPNLPKEDAASELSHLCTSQPSPSLPKEDAGFSFFTTDLASFLLNIPSESSFSHWNCMICSQREVSVVSLPCTHQVLCSQCYKEKCGTAGSRCAYCHAEIEESVYAYGPSS